MTQKKIRTSRTESQKRKIVALAQSRGTTEASREHNVPRSQIYQFARQLGISLKKGNKTNGLAMESMEELAQKVADFKLSNPEFMRLVIDRSNEIVAERLYR